MKKIFYYLMCIAAVFALSCCAPEDVIDEGEETEIEKEEGSETEDPGTDPETDPGDDPGTDPGTEDPDPEDGQLSVTLKIDDASNVSYTTVTLSGSFEARNHDEYYNSVDFYMIASDSDKTAEEIVSGGNKYGTQTMNIEKEDSVYTYVTSTSRLDIATKYYYTASITIGETPFYGEVKSFTTSDIGTIPEEVDMGSGIIWRGWNLGASKPEEYGDYYAWGETEEKNSYTDDEYKFHLSYGNFSKYTTNKDYAPNKEPDNLSVLQSQDDAVVANLGGAWRMPTQEEAQALIDACKGYWTSLNGVVGTLLVSKKNGATLFLPASGHIYGSGSEPSCTGDVELWTATVHTPYNKWGVCLNASIDYYGAYKLLVAGFDRYMGRPTRPVK